MMDGSGMMKMMEGMDMSRPMGAWERRERARCR